MGPFLCLLLTMYFAQKLPLYAELYGIWEDWWKNHIPPFYNSLLFFKAQKLGLYIIMGTSVTNQIENLLGH
jgi:hypothetical protein